MRKTGAYLVRYALEELGIKYTFGIPGVHNTEIYDELNKSESIEPILVTHEGGGSFMADAISRTSDQIGTLVVVPAAGLTHAASGIGEAGLDGVPMLVITGGIRTDGMNYQLHDIDQHAMMAPLVKKTYKVLKHEDIVPTIFDAYREANNGEPGPVFVEVPLNIGLFKGNISALPSYKKEQYPAPMWNKEELDAAVEMLVSAHKPGLFVGWGAVEASETIQELAHWLGCPVATTLQGLSVMPANHPLHTGMGFGSYAVPAAYESFKKCDCLLAVATRFSEIPTGSFGVNIPSNLIHIDINPDVFSANYPARITQCGDAKALLVKLLEAIKERLGEPRNSEALQASIQKHKSAYIDEWLKHDSKGRVNPARFFMAARQNLNDDDLVVCDDGNHTFLSAELMPIHTPRGFISPTDFNAMGYCVPASIGTKFVNPDKRVMGIVGDGAFMMTCMELLTAVTHKLGMVIVIFNDGELAQIAQAQKTPYNRKTCTQLSGFKPEGVAMATGAKYILLENNQDIDAKLSEAFEIADKGQPVILDVMIDYSKATRFTKGIVKTNLARFEFQEKFRFIGRAFKRHLFG